MACPDCGQSFRPRGLASHRRHKHGESTPDDEPPARAETPVDEVAAALPARPTRRASAEASGPAAALPAGTSSQGSLESPLREIARALRTIGLRLEGIESLLASGASRWSSQRISRAEELNHLQHELAEVFDAVEREKVASRRRLESWGGTPRTPQEEDMERDARQRLGDLRRRQAILLFRMGDDVPASNGLPGRGLDPL